MSKWQRFMEEGVELQFDDSEVLFGHIKERHMLLNWICESLKNDSEIHNLIGKVRSFGIPGFSVNDYGILWFGLRLCVLSSGGLHNEIMTEGHNYVYSVHPRYIKMYRDL